MDGEQEFIDLYLKTRRPRVMGKVSGTMRGSFLYPSWPYPYLVNDFAKYFEYGYEFLRGSRLASPD